MLPKKLPRLSRDRSYHDPFNFRTSKPYVSTVSIDRMTSLSNLFVGKNNAVRLVDPPSKNNSTEETSITIETVTVSDFDIRGAKLVRPKDGEKSTSPELLRSMANLFLFFS
jgi:hypothetical protein